MGLLIDFLLGLFIVAGACIARFAKNSERATQIAIAVGFGALTALALSDLLPEAAEHFHGRMLLLPVIVVAGIALLKLLDLFIPEHEDPQTTDETCTDANMAHIGIISAIAVTLHNLIEGMTVYSMTQTSLRTGALIALGVGLHNIPMGMVIASTLAHEHRAKRAGMLGLAALSTFLGGLIMHYLWFMITDTALGVLIGLTLGMIIYIAFLELLPHMLHMKNRRLSVAGALAGMLIVVAATAIGG